MRFFSSGVKEAKTQAEFGRSFQKVVIRSYAMIYRGESVFTFYDFIKQPFQEYNKCLHRWLVLLP